jgi:ankyrin repeat protein
MRMLLSVFLVTIFTYSSSAQSLIEDLVENNISGAKKKIQLLEPDMKEKPYVANYVRETKEFKPSSATFIVQSGADITQADEYGLTPLSYSILRNDSSYKWLFANDKRLDPNQKIKVKSSTFAAIANQMFNPPGREFRMDQFYVFTPLVMTEADEYFFSPLWIAVEMGTPETVTALLDAGADPFLTISQFKDLKKSTAKKPVYVTNDLIDYILADFDYSSKNNYRPDAMLVARAALVLQKAAKLNPKSVSERLSKFGASIYASIATGDEKAVKKYIAAFNGDTRFFIPYMLAIGNWNLTNAVIESNGLTLDSSFNDNPSDEGHTPPITPLVWGLTNRSTAAVKMVLDHGAEVPSKISYLQKISSVSWTERSPIEYSILNNLFDALSLLAQKATKNELTQSLRWCRDKPEYAQLLISRGAEFGSPVVMSSYDGFTGYQSRFYASFLFSAAFDNDPVMVDFYLKLGLDPNGTSGDARPILAAVFNKNVDIFELLLKAGASENVRVWNNLVYGWSDTTRELVLRDLIILLSKSAKSTSDRQSYDLMLEILGTHSGESKDLVAPIVDVEMIAVKGGVFSLGNNSIPGNNRWDPHDVEVSDFKISKFKITQGLYYQVTGKSPISRLEGLELPVSNISWEDAVQFCNRLSEQRGLVPAYAIGTDGNVSIVPDSTGYRLPTDAQWEYAARGGVANSASSYAGMDALPKNGISLTLVTESSTNSLGVAGLTDFFSEYCFDMYSTAIPKAKVDPVVERDKSFVRVFRGGGMTVTSRGYGNPRFVDWTRGFRVTLPGEISAPK